MEPVGARSGSISQNNALAMSSKLRRESMVNGDMARSLMGGGMSWGGVSVGSWIRDEYVYILFFAPPEKLRPYYTLPPGLP